MVLGVPVFKHFRVSVTAIALDYAAHVHIILAAHAPLKSLTTKQQTTKFSSANFQKMLNPSYIILRIQRQEGKQCRSR